MSNFRIRWGEPATDGVRTVVVEGTHPDGGHWTYRGELDPKDEAERGRFFRELAPKMKLTGEQVQQLECRISEVARRQRTEAKETEPRPSRVKLASLGEVRGSRIDWLWPGRIPLGKITLLIIDPISAYLPGEENSNTAIRRLLAPLAALAARRNLAVLAVSHLNKAQRAAAVYRTIGSLAFIAASRAAWLVAQDPKNPARRLLVPLKLNVSRDTGALGFQLSSEEEETPPTVRWELERTPVDVEELLRPSREARATPRLDDAACWLRGWLRLSEFPVNALKDISVVSSRHKPIPKPALRRKPIRGKDLRLTCRYLLLGFVCNEPLNVQRR